MTAVFRTPDERFENLPGYAFQPNYVEVDGLRLHHIDEGAGPTVLCFHGEPDWSYLYRHMTGALVKTGHRVVGARAAFADCRNCRVSFGVGAQCRGCAAARR